MPRRITVPTPIYGWDHPLKGPGNRLAFIEHDRPFPGTFRFRDEQESREARILAARLLVRITEHKGEAVDAEVVADAARRLPSDA